MSEAVEKQVVNGYTSHDIFTFILRQNAPPMTFMLYDLEIPADKEFFCCLMDEIKPCVLNKHKEATLLSYLSLNMINVDYQRCISSNVLLHSDYESQSHFFDREGMTGTYHELEDSFHHWHMRCLDSTQYPLVGVFNR